LSEKKNVEENSVNVGGIGVVMEKIAEN